MELSAGKLWGLRRLADDNGRFKMLAVDQRPPIKNLVADRRATDEALYEDVCAVKTMLVEELAGDCSAVLVDPHYAYPAAFAAIRPGHGLLLTLEDSVFVEEEGGRRSSAIDGWSVAKIKRTGADAVKVLAWYRPDAEKSVRAHQEDLVAGIGEMCRRHDIPFVFELLLYPLPNESGHTTDYVEQPGKRADHVIESVATFAAPEFGVDLFKLESPWPAGEVPDPDSDGARPVQAHFDELGRVAARPWVMLSAGARADDFRRVLTFAYRAGASGYLAGRAIWWDAFQHFPDWQTMRAVLRETAVPYVGDINRLTDSRARPWTDHPVFGETGPALGGAGPDFRHRYPDFGEEESR